MRKNSLKGIPLCHHHHLNDNAIDWIVKCQADASIKQTMVNRGVLLGCATIQKKRSFKLLLNNLAKQ